MAGPRVLRLALVLGALLLVTSGCAIWPIWSRRMEGRVIDAETGEGIEGAEVFLIWSLWGMVPMAGRSDFGHRWVTTDADGHFVFSGHIEGRPWAFPAYTELRPSFEILHRSYGSFGAGFTRKAPESWRKLEFRIRPDERQLAWLNDPRYFGSLCSDLGPGCRRACEVWWGSDEPCVKYDALDPLPKR